jgi:hypothetical protein
LTPTIWIGPGGAGNRNFHNNENHLVSAPSFDICAPLQEFRWGGDSFELSPGVWIKQRADVPDLQGWNSRLSEDEQDKLFFAEHWLTFAWTEAAENSPAETVNLVLLSLWLVKPTKTHVAFRFKLGRDSGTCGEGRTRLLDRFQWIRDATEEAFDTADLLSAATYYRALATLNRTRGRLNDALRLTLSACVARQWQVALICFAAAAETVLTYDTGGGITRRLASAYACLVESEAARRDVAFAEFRKLYAIRSDIVHGRAGNVAPQERLLMLADFADLMRNLWRAAIQSDTRIAALEDADAQRRAYFAVLGAHYSPPR